jgi:hypothetical protein
MENQINEWTDKGYVLFSSLELLVVHIQCNVIHKKLYSRQIRHFSTFN